MPSKSKLAEQLKARNASKVPVQIPQVQRQPQQQIHRVAQQPVKRCRVADCTQCRAGDTHYCKHCGDDDSTHRASECDQAPENMRKAAQQINEQVKAAASHRVPKKEPRIDQGEKSRGQPQVKVKKEATGERPALDKKPVNQKAPQPSNKADKPCITVTLEVLFGMLKAKYLTRQEFDQAKEIVFGPSGMPADVVSGCAKLIKMKQEGFLTDDEFSKAKQSRLNHQ